MSYLLNLKNGVIKNLNYIYHFAANADVRGIINRDIDLNKIC